MHQELVTTTPTSNGDRSPISARSPRSAKILAKTIYRELRQSGLEEREVLAIASEMLGLVTEELRGS